jgi:hypothetical protein
VFDSTGVTATFTFAEEVETVFPEMSRIVTTGVVEIPARFTAPVAEVVRIMSVAVPAETFTTLVTEFSDRLGTLADTFLFPVIPRNLRSGNVARPEAAFLTNVPVSSGDDPAKETEGVPVVIKLPSASSIRTTTSEIPSLFTALDATSSSTVVANPWVNWIDCEVGTREPDEKLKV